MQNADTPGTADGDLSSADAAAAEPELEPEAPIEPTIFAAEPAPVFPAPAFGTALRGASALGLWFAFAGLLCGLRSLSIAVLPFILSPGPGLAFREAADGLPIPRLLDWNLTQIDTMISLAKLSGPTVLAGGVVLFGLLLLRSASALNPTFRLLYVSRRSSDLPPADSTSPDSPDEPEPVSENAHLAIGLQAVALRKTLVLLAACCLPIGLLSLVLRTSTTASASGIGSVLNGRTALYVAAGLALWLGFRPDGFAGDFGRLKWHRPTVSLRGLIAAGACFGLVAAVLVHFAFPHDPRAVLLRYQTIGTFHRAYLLSIGARYLFSAAAVWFAAGSLLYVLGRPALSSGRRWGLLALPLLAAIAALGARHPMSPGRLDARLDISPELREAIARPAKTEYPEFGSPEGRHTAHEFARAAGLNSGPDTDLQTLQTDRSFLLFVEDGVVNGRQPRTTIDGLSLTADSANKSRAFLSRRAYKSALSWMAIRQIFDAATYRFDTTTAIDSLLLDLENCPHLRQVDFPLNSLFYICSASPQNLALLDRLADPAHFTFPDRQSLKNMGDLYVRFGQPQKALPWYRRAEMPKTFMRKMETVKPVFHAGTVTGRFTLNGKPLAGVQVGVVPRRLNGLPGLLEPLVMRADREMVLNPSPYAFRWISASAVTDGRGQFELNNLVEGEYLLIVVMPDDVQLEPLQDPSLRVRHAPRPLVLRYESPTAMLGTIRLSHRS